MYPCPIIRRDFNILEKNEIYLKNATHIKKDLHRIINKDIPVVGFDYIESINPNPVALPTLGNIISSIKGDILCRILKLDPVYYVNDAGSNFSKFLMNYRLYKDEPIESLYTLPMVSETELLKIRKQIFDSYPHDAISLRDAMVEKILLVYKRYNLLKPNLIYESNYLPQVKKAIIQSQIQQKGYFYKGVHIATSLGLPLYIAADYFYHLDIDQKYSNKLQLVSKDHSKYIKVIDKMTENPWVYNIGAIVHYKGEKLSKRKGHDLQIEDLVEQASNLEEKDLITLLKLFCMKYEKRDKFELDQLIKQSLNPYILDPIKGLNPCTDEQFKKVVNELQEMNLDPLIRSWANLREILQWSVSRLDLNKIFKFIEHVHRLPKTEKTRLIHDKLMYNLIDFLGL